jgi:Anhydro-N-acetylmuramic acid kinase
LISEVDTDILPSPLTSKSCCPSTLTGAYVSGVTCKERVKPAIVRFSDDFGLPIDAKEAILFAVLGAETLCGQPGNLPSATDASRPVILGQIIPGRGWPEWFPPAAGN